MRDEELLELTDSSDATVRHTAAWEGFSLEQVVAVPGDSFSYQWTSDLHLCAYHDMILKDGGIRAEDGAEVHEKDLRNTLTYVPRGATVTGWSELAARRNSYTAIYFDPGTLHEELDQRFSDLQYPNIYFRDAELSTLMKQCTRLLLDKGRDQLYSETLGLMTVLGIHKATLSAPREKPPLAASALANVIDYIEANLSRSMSLSELAQIAGLSRFHFTRAFKATTGETPFEYVTRQRIERAKLLLANKSLNTQEIAVSVGLHDAAHLQKAFKAREGVSLLAFRKSL